MNILKYLVHSISIGCAIVLLGLIALLVIGCVIYGVSHIPGWLSFAFFLCFAVGGLFQLFFVDKDRP